MTQKTISARITKITVEFNKVIFHVEFSDGFGLDFNLSNDRVDALTPGRMKYILDQHISENLTKTKPVISNLQEKWLDFTYTKEIQTEKT